MADQIRYPAGAMLRVNQICTDRKTRAPGILPIDPRTWLKWVEEKRIPQGVLIGSRTRVWPIEVVMAICREGIPDKK